MKPILHIVKNFNDAHAIEVIKSQAKDNAYGVAAVFMQGGMSVPLIENVRTYLLVEDIENKTVSPGTPPHIEWIDYKGLLNLIFSVESITVW